MKINKDQIKHLIKKKSLKQKDVAKQLDVSPQDFNNWMFRGIFPHYDKLEMLAEILDTDTSLLYYEKNFNEPVGVYNKRISHPPEDLVPFYELDAHSGLSLLWSGISTMVPKDHVYFPGLNADFIYPYHGKGMEPFLENGDWIALRKVSDLSFFNYGNLHVVVTKEHVIVRDIKKSEQKNTILLHATSDDMDDIELPKKAIKALFAVITIVKRNLI